MHPEATDLLAWGVVLHLLVDWLGQNETIATRKMNLRDWPGWVHAAMHGSIQLLIFPWWAALAVGVTHLFIDTRKPVVWWSRTIGQTQPSGQGFDLGADVRIWVDQVWHIGAIAILALSIKGG